MKGRRAAKWLAASTAFCMILLGAASPASAATSIGTKDNFWFSCDASVYITDDLIGSPGKIEAWGGFSCQNQYWGGVMRVEIWRNNSKVAEQSKNVPGGAAQTDHVDVSMNNTAGTQSWVAKLWLSRPGHDSTLITTGAISS